eukprot:CAMPEP_0196597988 /NCGR_PEP_ID=MMETSP1081-20130531/94048_1 /TAXON_ID=36882 /ORGANISM="Pyramimonas amylifera, Strain CCMP720" /LENGTH=294 /DNA_ID=CAMNT_0041923593 /DNA_START=202 /DNA_END=1086 /DNA_ORIENTATION=-
MLGGGPEQNSTELEMASQAEDLKKTIEESSGLSRAGFALLIQAEKAGQNTENGIKRNRAHEGQSAEGENPGNQGREGKKGNGQSAEGKNPGNQGREGKKGNGFLRRKWQAVMQNKGQPGGTQGKKVQGGASGDSTLHRKKHNHEGKEEAGKQSHLNPEAFLQITNLTKHVKHRELAPGVGMIQRDIDRMLHWSCDRVRMQHAPCKTQPTAVLGHGVPCSEIKRLLSYCSHGQQYVLVPAPPGSEKPEDVEYENKHHATLQAERRTAKITALMAPDPPPYPHAPYRDENKKIKHQ